MGTAKVIHGVRRRLGGLWRYRDAALGGPVLEGVEHLDELAQVLRRERHPLAGRHGVDGLRDRLGYPDERAVRVGHLERVDGHLQRGYEGVVSAPDGHLASSDGIFTIRGGYSRLTCGNSRSSARVPRVARRLGQSRVAR